MIPVIISGAAAALMGAVVVASLFMGFGMQGGDRASGSTLAHAQHHIISIR